jgi:hypothetical protein
MVDSITEKGLSLVYSNSHKSLSPDSLVFSKEAPPRECLGDPYINDEAKDLLTNDMKWLASKDTLLSLALMTVARKEPANKILTQAMSGRTTVVRHGQIGFADNVGGIVIEKGGWESGDVFTGEYGPQLGLVDDDETPWGLYGSKESKHDIKISTALIKKGFKAALSLGFIPLEPAKTRNWLLSKFKGDEIMGPRIDRSFAIVKQNNDVPVLDFRVGGVEYRINSIYGITSEHASAFLAHAAKLMKEEMSKYPKKYMGYYSFSEHPDKRLAVLDKVSKRIPLNEAELVQFLDIYLAVGRKNTSSWENFLKHRKDLGVGLLSGRAAMRLGNSKDVCYAGYTYDFEELETCDAKDDNLSLDVENKLPEVYFSNWYGMIRDWGIARNLVDSSVLRKAGFGTSWFCNKFHSLR